MESFEQKIKERNNLLKSQVDALTGRNELLEVIDTLLKAGVAEEDLVEKAKFIRKESNGKGGYKYIYEEPKENKIKTDKVDKKEKTNEELAQFHREQMELANKNGDGAKYHYHVGKRDMYKKLAKEDKQKSSESDLEKAEQDKKKKKVAKVMKEFKAGTLKTSAGDPVKNRDQAIAIAMSEAGMSKSELVDLIKAGEGSKGGKVIGHTKSGKPIYESHSHPDHANFSKEDHADAAAEHEKRRMATVNSPDFNFNKKLHKQLTTHKHGYAYHWSRSTGDKTE